MTDAGGVLATSVTLLDPKFRLATFPAGSTPPAWAQALITNPKAWASAPEPEPDAPAETSPVGDVGAGEAETAQAPSPAPETPATAEATPEPSEAEEDLIGGLPEPPKRGAGSGRDAWVAYANSKNVEFAPDATRDEIIAAVEAAAE